MRNAAMQQPAIVTAPEAIVHRIEDAVWYDVIADERQTLVVDSSDVDGRFTLIEVVAEPGAGTPRHTHAEAETFRILEGTATFACGEAMFDAGPGTTVTVPAGGVHAWKNRTDAPVRMLVLFAPGGIERMFPRIAGADMDEIAELVLAYGSEIVGPPIAD